MTQEQKKVLEFHEVMGGPIRRTPGLNPDHDKLRYDLIKEELGELQEAQQDGDLVEIADALGDILYVVYGAAVTYGIDLEHVFNEIHESNMTKVGGEKRADGKILKPPHYRRPNLAPIIAAQTKGDNDEA